MRTRRLSAAAVVVLVAVAGAGVTLSRVERAAPAVPGALASMPAETLTASVTDWARVRALLDGEGPEREALLARAYETDASAVSVLSDVAGVMARRYGWSVLDARWEGLAQSRRGAAIVVQLPGKFDLATVRSGLGALGYRAPADRSGVWRGGTDLVAGVDPSLSPLLAHAVVLDDSARVVFSDRAAYARRTAAAAEGFVAALGDEAAVDSIAARLRGAVAAVVHTGGRGCAVMGFGRASGTDRAGAARRIAAVGGVSRHAAVGLALLPGPDGTLRRPPLRVAMHVDGERAPSHEAQRRARLAVGEAPGQGGTYGSRFAVAAAWQRGGDVVLGLRPREPDSQLLSDLNAGELLFAACG